MSSPFIGEIRMFGGNFAPAGWAFCDGSLIPISENDALFNLIGTTYGGDGQTTFALPDLRSRVPVHMGTGPSLSPRLIGETGGVETVMLNTQQIPAHTHAPVGSSAAANRADPAGGFWATWADAQFSDQAPNAPVSAGAIPTVGGGQPHDNMLPFLTINFILSLFGIFPSQ